MVVAAWNNNGFVLLGASHKLLAAAFAEAFNQHIKLFSFVFLVLDSRNLGLKFYEFIQTAYLFLFRNIVGQMLCCVGSGTF